MKYIKLYEDFNELLDKPREVCVMRPDYKNIVSKVKSAREEDIPKLIENWVNENEKEMAEIIVSDDSNYIYCEHAAEIAGQIMGDAGLDHQLETGVINIMPNSQSHAWARTKSGFIVDPTKSQFRDIKEEDYSNATNLSIFVWNGKTYDDKKI